MFDGAFFSRVEVALEKVQSFKHSRLFSAFEFALFDELHRLSERQLARVVTVDLQLHSVLALQAVFRLLLRVLLLSKELIAYLERLDDHLLNVLLLNDLVEELDQNGQVLAVLRLESLRLPHHLIDREVCLMHVHKEVVVLTEQLDPDHIRLVVGSLDQKLDHQLLLGAVRFTPKLLDQAVVAQDQRKRTLALVHKAILVHFNGQLRMLLTQTRVALHEQR